MNIENLFNWSNHQISSITEITEEYFIAVTLNNHERIIVIEEDNEFYWIFRDEIMCSENFKSEPLFER